MIFMCAYLCAKMTIKSIHYMYRYLNYTVCTREIRQNVVNIYVTTVGANAAASCVRTFGCPCGSLSTRSERTSMTQLAASHMPVNRHSCAGYCDKKSNKQINKRWSHEFTVMYMLKVSRMYGTCVHFVRT